MTVLLVEDNLTIRKLVCQILRWKNFEVLDAGSGDEALALLEASPHAVDLILTDVDLPGMSGTDLVGRLQPMQPQARVLYMSGENQPIPDAHYLEKPFTPDRLLASVQEALTS